MPNKKYSEGAMVETIEAIRNGTMTIYKAAKVFNIPKQALSDKLRNKYTKQSSAGVPNALIRHEEEKIVQWIQHLAKIGFPITKYQLIYNVSKLVKKMDRPNKFKDGIPIDKGPNNVHSNPELGTPTKF